MRIGIDISQIVYEQTGVANYVRNLVKSLVILDKQNDYLLFGSSFRKRSIFQDFFEEMHKENAKVRLVSLPLPPIVLDFFWNRLHILPVEVVTGNLDVFWSSDWTQPPLRHARGLTTIHDLAIDKVKNEMNVATSMEIKSLRLIPNIYAVQKRRLMRAVKECQMFICDSRSTKRDFIAQYGVPEGKVTVIYPGYRL